MRKHRPTTNIQQQVTDTLNLLDWTASECLMTTTRQHSAQSYGWYEATNDWHGELSADTERWPFAVMNFADNPDSKVRLSPSDWVFGFDTMEKIYDIKYGF